MSAARPRRWKLAGAAPSRAALVRWVRNPEPTIRGRALAPPLLKHGEQIDQERRQRSLGPLAQVAEQVTQAGQGAMS